MQIDFWLAAYTSRYTIITKVSVGILKCSCAHCFSGMVSLSPKRQTFEERVHPRHPPFLPSVKSATWRPPPTTLHYSFLHNIQGWHFCNLNKTLQINTAHLCVPNWLETWCRRKWDVIWNVYSHGGLFILFSQPRTICWLLLFPVRVSQRELFCFWLFLVRVRSAPSSEGWCFGTAPKSRTPAPTKQHCHDGGGGTVCHCHLISACWVQHSPEPICHLR